MRLPPQNQSWQSPWAQESEQVSVSARQPFNLWVPSCAHRCDKGPSHTRGIPTTSPRHSWTPRLRQVK